MQKKQSNKVCEMFSPLEQEKRLRKLDEGLACRLHVSNLPFIFREPHLASLFSSCGGTVTDVQVVTNEKGSKGFGFVSLSNSEEAAVAQRMLHGTVVEGRRIEVNPATPKVRSVRSARMLRATSNEETMLQNERSQMLELVEAQTRLAEAQLAVLQMRNTILNSQVSKRSLKTLYHLMVFNQVGGSSILGSKSKTI